MHNFCSIFHLCMKLNWFINVQLLQDIFLYLEVQFMHIWIIFPQLVAHRKVFIVSELYRKCSKVKLAQFLRGYIGYIFWCITGNLSFFLFLACFVLSEWQASVENLWVLKKARWCAMSRWGRAKWCGRPRQGSGISGQSTCCQKNAGVAAEQGFGVHCHCCISSTLVCCSWSPSQEAVPMSFVHSLWAGCWVRGRRPEQRAERGSVCPLAARKAENITGTLVI